ncbi:unnamed protein product [Paramecium primaurelia]|uniref:Uncharacterized protein n=1 Tax=Paramecium primaurelia TaxID=5886 RepID=A0A8S1LX28_PARPR|nr:unnamed protein product [Paramecium primaurelia]
MIKTLFQKNGFVSQQLEQRIKLQINSFQIADFPVDQNLVLFAINNHCIVFKTNRNKLYRLRYMNRIAKSKQKLKAINIIDQF